MIVIIKKYLSSYNPTYWISILIICLLSLALYISTNISTAPNRQMKMDAIADSEEIQGILYGIETEFSIFNTLLNDLVNREYTSSEDTIWLDNVNDRFNLIMDSFHSLHPNVSGYFINVTGETSNQPLLQTYTDILTSNTSHISVLMDSYYIDSQSGLNTLLSNKKSPMFITISNDMTKKFELAYTAPLYIGDEYRGFFGITVDLESLSNLFQKDSARNITLLTKDLEILITNADYPTGARLEGIKYASFAPLADKIRSTVDNSGYIRLHYDGKMWMNIFITLSSGQIYWESFSLSERFSSTNTLIIILSVFAILCLWMVQKKDSISPFDKLADLMLGRVSLSDDQTMSYKAFFGTHIGLTGALFALSLFSLIGSATIYMTVGYVVSFIIAAVAILLFKKANLSIFQRYIYLITCLVIPVFLHHLSGGFAAQSGSLILPWCVITVTISAFLLDERHNRRIFSTFVIVLFLDAVMEIVYIPGTNPEYVIRFLTIIFFLGFALFVSTNLYVTGVFNVVKKLNDAYVKLQDTQSQLVKEEKMITLGRLIAGIAHEINTPLGAIKASAEGIENSLKNSFLSLMDSQLSQDEATKQYFFRLLDLANESMSDMFTSMQVRKAKPLLMDFFEELGCKEPDVMIQKLVRLEMCNLERIKENRDIFESPHIMELLSLLVATTPIVKGSYIILEASGRAYKIIFALKSYSHTNVSSDPVLFSLTSNIDNVLLLLYNQIKMSIEVTRQYDDDIPEMLGNPDELGQVWLNLIQNAIYAMGGHGAITIKVKNDGKLMHVYITDNGPGIANDVIKHVFEPFYTTKSAGEGTGLGLDICKKIITEHHGDIEVESKLGEWTTFHIWLPFNSKENGYLYE